MRIAITLPCYKRVLTLSELLDTLLAADFGGDIVDIVFSIDYSGEKNVHEMAENFHWPFGEKIIIDHPQNLGLRNNILSCGDLTDLYDAVIVLEDDLEVTPSFYRYAKQAAEFYADDDRIGGISIYAYHLEEITLTEFYPIYEGYDGVLIQWASSWGQLWTRRQWNKFKDWYGVNEDISSINIPTQVKRWKKSWKKYYIAYLKDTNRYFVFPFFSHVYNGDKIGGVHTIKKIGEVLTSSPLCFSTLDFKFGKFDHLKHRYDAYFQHAPILIDINKNQYECELDLFGHKEYSESAYIITSKKCAAINCIHQFDDGMMPIELNIINKKEGVTFNLIKKEDFEKCQNIPIENYTRIRKRILGVKAAIKWFGFYIFNVLKNKF